MMKTIARPKINIRNCSNSRKSSGSSVTATAAMSTPRMEPMPPSTTMARMIADSMKVNEDGLMNPSIAAYITPPMPPKDAPSVNAESLVEVWLMPSALQAISSSRSASQARPMGMLRRRLKTSTDATANTSASRYMKM